MKNIKEYKTTGEWFRDMKKENYSIPLSMCHGLDIAQQKFNLSFSEAFRLLLERKIIIKSDSCFIYKIVDIEKLDVGNFS